MKKRETRNWNIEVAYVKESGKTRNRETKTKDGIVGRRASKGEAHEELGDTKTYRERCQGTESKKSGAKTLGDGRRGVRKVGGTL